MYPAAFIRLIYRPLLPFSVGDRFLVITRSDVNDLLSKARVVLRILPISFYISGYKNKPFG